MSLLPILEPDLFQNLLKIINVYNPAGLLSSRKTLGYACKETYIGLFFATLFIIGKIGNSSESIMRIRNCDVVIQ